MRVANRLYLAALPALVGVVLVAALAYWGQYSRTVPELFLVIAAAATVATLAMSWVNVRYVAARVERLARLRGHDRRNTADRLEAESISPTAMDELDHIEGVVANLNNAVQFAEGARQRDERQYQQATAAYANMLISVSSIATRQIDEVRLPLHILLDNHFGELNENQEELLGAARAAAERADVELASLQKIAELDLGVRTLRNDRVYPADLLQAILPMMQSVAAQHGVPLRADIPPLVPAMRGDASQLQKAMVVLFGEAIAGAGATADLQLVLKQIAGAVRMELTGARAPAASIQSQLAERVILASGGACEYTGEGLILTFTSDHFVGATTGFSK